MSSAMESLLKRAADLAATATVESGSALEDKTNKKCSLCLDVLPEYLYSGAQLKKKGKRVCKACQLYTSEHQRNLAQSPPAKFTNAKVMQCTECGKRGVSKVFTCCARCSEPYCTDKLYCLNNHLFHARCGAMASQPTAEISAEDCFTAADLNKHLPRLLEETHRRIAHRTAQVIKSNMQDVAPTFKFKFSRADAVMLQLISRAPSADHCWWKISSSESAAWNAYKAVNEAANNAASWIRVLEAVHSTPQLLVDAMTRPTMHASDVGTESESSLFDDESRFFHKLLRHCIFFRRHSEGSRENVRLHERDDYGVLIMKTINNPAFKLADGIAYCTYAPEDGGVPYLVPMSWWQKQSSCGFVVASARHRGGVRCLLTENGQIVTQPGIVIMGPAFCACASRDLYKRSSDVVFAYSGLVTGDVNKSFRQSDYESQMVDDDALSHLVDEDVGEVSDRIAAELNQLKQQLYKSQQKLMMSLHKSQQHDPTFHFHRTLQAALADEWPAKDDLAFVALPQPNSVESDLVELLALEELLEESQKEHPDAAALLLIASVEEATGESFAAVVESARQRMQRMIGEQRDEHADIVKRAGMRSGKGNYSASASAAGASSSPSSSLSASSSSAAAPAGALSSSSSSTSSTLARTSDSDKWSAAPMWLRQCKSFKQLIAGGVPKFRPLKKILRALWSLPQMCAYSESQAGSHRNFHFPGGGFTLVEHHSGGGKDTAVPKFVITRVAECLVAVAMDAYSRVPAKARAK